MRFEIPFSGHKNITALHQKTIEITTEPKLTINGDCIVGINASCGCNGIPEKLKKEIRDPSSKIKFSIIVDSQSFTVNGHGSKDLKLSHPHDIVLRKSKFVCPRTIAIGCNKASSSIPKKMIKVLQDPQTKGIFVIEVT
ncbi:MAG: DUF371 domain-containing protein [Nitrosopumilaceae archaeon]